MFQADFQALVGLATLLLGVITYLINSQREKAIRRAELVRAYTCQFSGDQDLVNLFTEIDYSRFRFERDEHWLGQKPEQTVVRLLDLFNSVGHNWGRKVLTLQDVEGTTLGYALLRAYRDDHIREYLRFVDHWDAAHSGTGRAFEHFRRVAIALDNRSAANRAGRTKRLNG
jgi:hypothetical protein